MEIILGYPSGPNVITDVPVGGGVGFDTEEGNVTTEARCSKASCWL